MPVGQTQQLRHAEPQRPGLACAQGRRLTADTVPGPVIPADFDIAKRRPRCTEYLKYRLAVWPVVAAADSHHQRRRARASRQHTLCSSARSAGRQPAAREWPRIGHRYRSWCEAVAAPARSAGQRPARGAPLACGLTAARYRRSKRTPRPADQPERRGSSGPEQTATRPAAQPARSRLAASLPLPRLPTAFHRTADPASRHSQATPQLCRVRHMGPPHIMRLLPVNVHMTREQTT